MALTSLKVWSELPLLPVATDLRDGPLSDRTHPVTLVRRVRGGGFEKETVRIRITGDRGRKEGGRRESGNRDRERGRRWEKVPPGRTRQASGDWAAQSPRAAAGESGPGPGGLRTDSSSIDVLRTTALRSETQGKQVFPREPCPKLTGCDYVP